MRFPSTLLVLALAAFSAGVLAGQKDVLRVNTRLVEVDVVVRAKDGPVTNLGKDDFTILDNGAAQRVDVFSVSRAERPKSKETLAPLPAGVVSNRNGAEPPRSATVILFDRLNTLEKYQRDGRLQLISYLKSTRREDLTAIYALADGLKLVQDFTNDADLLVRAATKMEVGDLPGIENRTVQEIAQSTAVGRVRGRDVRMAVAETQISVAERTDPTEDAIEFIARHLSALSGRKSLIWMSAAGIPMSIAPGTSRNGRESQVDHATRLLAAANIAVYPVDIRGLLAPDPPRGRRGIAPSPPPDVMMRLADQTGGRAFYFTNDLEGSIRTAISDTEVTYTLGFYPTENGFDGKFHTLEVKVARKDVEVRHRTGYFSEKDQAPDEKERRAIITELFSSPFDASQIGLQAAVQPVSVKDKSYRVLLRVDAADLHLEQSNDHWTGILDVAMRLESSKQKGVELRTVPINLSEEQFRAVLLRGLLLEEAVKVDRPVDRLHIVLQDRATGFAGSLRLPIESSSFGK